VSEAGASLTPIVESLVQRQRTYVAAIEQLSECQLFGFFPPATA
jgi:hypothetical protein